MAKGALLSIFILNSLLSTVGAASTSVALSDFQALPENVSIPVTCALAYASNISGCKTTDFTNGAACSSSCIAALGQLSRTLNTVCPGVVVSSATLLGIVFQGSLVAQLCPNTVKTTSTPQASTKAKTTVLSTPPQPITTSIAPGTVPATSTPKTIASTTAASNTPASSADSPIVISSTSSSLSLPATAVPSPSRSTNSVVAASSSGNQKPTTSTSRSTTSTATPAPSKGSSAQSQQNEANSQSGGGSPFDIVVGNSASLMMKVSGSSLAATLLGLLWSWILFGR